MRLTAFYPVRSNVDRDKGCYADAPAHGSLCRRSEHWLPTEKMGHLRANGYLSISFRFGILEAAAPAPCKVMDLNAERQQCIGGVPCQNPDIWFTSPRIELS